MAHFPTAVKEFDWRNGFFWDLSEAAEDEGEDGARVVPVDGEDLELAHDAMAMSLTLCDGCDS